MSKRSRRRNRHVNQNTTNMKKEKGRSSAPTSINWTSKINNSVQLGKDISVHDKIKY